MKMKCSLMCNLQGNIIDSRHSAMSYQKLIIHRGGNIYSIPLTEEEVISYQNDCLGRSLNDYYKLYSRTEKIKSLAADFPVSLISVCVFGGGGGAIDL